MRVIYTFYDNRPIKKETMKCLARKQDAYFTRKDAQRRVTSREGYHVFAVCLVTPTLPLKP
jgi:hypothetical protein